MFLFIPDYSDIIRNWIFLGFHAWLFILFFWITYVCTLAYSTISYMVLQILSIQPKLNFYIRRDLSYIQDYWILSQKHFYFIFFCLFEFCVWRNLTIFLRRLGILSDDFWHNTFLRKVLVLKFKKRFSIWSFSQPFYIFEII